MNAVYLIAGGIGIVGIALTLFMLRNKLPVKKRGSHGTPALLNDEKLLSSVILNSIEDGVILVDEKKTIKLLNPAAAKLAGWNGADAIGLDYHAVIKLVDAKGEAINELQDPFEKVFSDKIPVRENSLVLLTQNSKQLAVSLSLSPLRGEADKLVGAVCVFRDISQDRQEEQRRADFVSTASHEMRTPVAAIEGYLALALNDKVSKIDAHARDYLEKAHSSTQHLGKLFQDLLTSAKAEDGRLVSHPVVVEMGEYLEQLTDSLKFAAEKKGLFMEFTIGTSAKENTLTGRVIKPLYYTFLDPDRLREVVSNLFDNAVKYTETGKISIGLTGNNEVVQLYIRDTGPGISADDIPHLFQKFYRVDNSVTRTIGGTGLGLFICRKIVELYNGRIWAESQINKGSTFYINFPRLTTEKATELQTAEANKAFPTAAPAASPTV